LLDLSRAAGEVTEGEIATRLGLAECGRLVKTI